MSHNLHPIKQTNREQSLDTLRGFAIVGVLFALFLEWDNFGIPPGEEKTSAFKIIHQAATIFLHGKAYNLLAFLFGYGFALQVSRAKQKGVDLLPYALRRALGLFLLGTLHAVLLRDGDILAPYAIWSLFIIGLRNSGDRKILVAIVGSLFISSIYFLILKWTGNEPAPYTVDVKGQGLIAKNISYLLQFWYPHFIEFQWGALLLFLMGMYASRRRWLERLQNNPRQLKILFFAGLILCFSYFVIPWKNIFRVDGNFKSPGFYQNLLNNFLSSTIKLPFGWGIDMVYIAILLQLLRITTTRKMLQPLTDMGKMALTNYLLPDIFFIPVFFLIFNLWAKVPAIQQVLMATTFSFFLAWFSTWWLKRYNFGPFEWLLRSFTYWKWQPMNKKETIQKTEVVA